MRYTQSGTETHCLIVVFCVLFLDDVVAHYTSYVLPHHQTKEKEENPGGVKFYSFFLELRIALGNQASVLLKDLKKSHLITQNF